MLDLSPRREAPPVSITAATAAALTQAAAALARLDQALDHHPLTPALLHRARLDAVRRQAAVDGFAIDPWHLAALLEGLRLRMESSLRIIDRGMIFDAGRHALTQHQWLTVPDFDQEGEIRRATTALAATEPGSTPLLAAAHGVHDWLDRGGDRAPMRAALIRHWMRHRLLRVPVPLTGAAALRPDTPWAENTWVPEFLTALAGEADDARQLLLTLERAWVAARRAIACRRRTSRAAAALDLMAATPLLSATSLAKTLGMAVKNAAALLDGFCTAGIAVEVTHRSKRRLFGLAGLAPLRAAVAPPYRPHPGRGRGRPPHPPAEATVLPELPLPAGPLTPARAAGLRHHRARSGDGLRRRGDPRHPPPPRSPARLRPPSARIPLAAASGTLASCARRRAGAGREPGQPPGDPARPPARSASGVSKLETSRGSAVVRIRGMLPVGQVEESTRSFY